MIEVANLTRGKIDEKYLTGVAKKVLKGENRRENISIVFVGKKRMRDLNRKYRKQDKITDVLSFGEELNEIIICLKLAQNKEGLNRLLIHAILHLLGYEHSNKMEKKQEYYLNLFKCLNV